MRDFIRISTAISLISPDASPARFSSARRFGRFIIIFILTKDTWPAGWWKRSARLGTEKISGQSKSTVP